MATPSVRDSFSADPASLTPEQKKELITRNLEVRYILGGFCFAEGERGSFQIVKVSLFCF